MIWSYPRKLLNCYSDKTIALHYNTFCDERHFMMSLSDDKQADIIDALITTARYFDDILKINNVYFDNMVSHIYHSELQLK